MSDYITKTASTDLSNITALSVIPDDPYYARSGKPAKASKRFFQSAALLPEGEFLGWQLCASKDSHYSSFAFSSSKTEVSAEDFNWIFQECATVSDESTETFADLENGHRKLYALRFQQGNKDDAEKSGKQNNSMYGDDERDYSIEMLDMMGEVGGILHIISEPDGNGLTGHGEILLSLPDTVTLRMRAMLSLVFPHTILENMQDSQNISRQLPMKNIADGMAGLLKALMYKAEIQREADSEDEDEMFAMEEELCDSPESESVMESSPIEDLELSVRAYNCLKRAGVDSVGELLAMSDDELRHVRNLGLKVYCEIKEKLAKVSSPSASVPLTAPSYSSMLDELIGLAEVKEQVRKITAFGKMKRDMETRMEKPVSIAMNMEFVGNPGTAKTTVARIIAGIFHEAGILSSNELVEVGRADLVAKYVGQTADKVKSIFRQAKGKLLFIDEAYSLVENWEGEFGDEAINTIVQEMENNRKDTIVIFAGYPDKMEAFFSRNPGLRSRVPFKISFPDYSADEMVQIVELETQKRGFAIHPQARDKIIALCGSASGGTDAGNGRFCRNLVENAILGYAARVYGNSDEPENRDFVLIDSDFSVSDTHQKRKEAVPMGFRV